ncbi:8422_t:CDS:2 [Dentiscutata erythropus]|uniref:8422_t:CDS:1 n=1 Tax=Dentiscutata erythropus TaxID=1348616 RepID=A0A9N9GNQ9_9GLOM|nr:8422_t:CDS:2 [Dentiscutata erythropus]
MTELGAHFLEKFLRDEFELNNELAPSIELDEELSTSAELDVELSTSAELDAELSTLAKLDAELATLINLKAMCKDWTWDNDDLAYYDILDLTPGSNSTFAKSLPEIYKTLNNLPNPQKKDYEKIKKIVDIIISPNLKKSVDELFGNS